MDYQLRVYTLASPSSAEIYRRIWEKHIISLERLGIRTHGVFCATDDRSKVIALVSYPEGADPRQLDERYMASDAFRSDMAGFDFHQIVSVEATLLTPETFSPLR